MKPGDAGAGGLTFGRMILGALRFYWRSHLGVVLGAAVGSAALIGALVVGDSVRESLRAQAEARLGAAEVVLDAGDRWLSERFGGPMSFGPALARSGEGGHQFTWGGAHRFPWTAGVLHLRGTVSRQDGTARALQVHVYGATSNFWAFSPAARRLQRSGAWGALGGAVTAEERTSGLALIASWQRPEPGRVRLGTALARQLSARPGDTLVVRLPKPSALSPDAVLSPRNEASVVLRVVVDDVVDAEGYGDFSLVSGQGRALNAFVNLEELWGATGLTNRYNLVLAQGGEWRSAAGEGWRERLHRWVTANQGWIPRAIVRAVGRGMARSETSPALASATRDHLGSQLERLWQLEDAQIGVRVVSVPGDGAGGSETSGVEVWTPRVFLGAPVVQAATRPDPALPAADQAERDWMTQGRPVLTYLANALRSGERLTPYSMVTAAGPPWTPEDLGDDEIVVNEWLAKDLGVGPGDRVEMVFFDPGAGARLVERTNRFRVREVVPLRGVHADRTLMPEFPGLADAETTRDWDAGFPLEHRIRDQDEAYWKEHRGTPKAFVSRRAGEAMWGNRFGAATAVRYAVPAGMAPEAFRASVAANLRANLRPADVGLSLHAVRAAALRAAATGQDFGGLFLGFSFFLVLAALILMGLLFQFGLEQRLAEVGTLLAVGYRTATVRRLWLGEGLGLAWVGGVFGVAGGLVYAWAMIRGLTSIWRDAVAGAALEFHVTLGSLVAGLVASVVVCGVTLWFTLRRQFARPARALLSGDVASPSAGARRRGGWWGLAAVGGGLGLAGWAVATGQTANAGAFFGAGSLVLSGGLGCFAAWLGGRGRGVAGHPKAEGCVLTSAGLAVRGTARRRSRSLATAGLLACGTFVVAALGVFRLDAGRDAWKRDAGTGGFALIGEASLPIVQDLNRRAGLEAYGLSPEDVPGVRFVPFRVRDGDEASCLNLNRAQRPRILGVNPEWLSGRGAFRFAGVAAGEEVTRGWGVLRGRNGEAGMKATLGAREGMGSVPAVGDGASIQWALGRKLGDELELSDEAGRPVRLRLAGALANSILQGSLVVEESAFERLFPGEAGYRFFLIDVPTNAVAATAATLSRAFEDVGLQVTPAARRLAEFNAVQNTYLSTFQVLGGLGLLLGSAGLGIVVLRNVLERRGELALMTAVGFRRRALARLVLVEHAALLGVGLGLGLASAAVAVLPSVLAPSMDLPWRSLLGTLAGVAGLGLLTAWVATRTSLRGSLVQALRGE